MTAALAPTLVLGVLIGAALGLLGGGGSVLTVPLFVYALGFDPKHAIAMSLAVVGATSAFGTAAHWRAGYVNMRIAAIFGAVAIAGTFVGVRLANFVSGTTQLVVFGAVMLTAAVFMLKGDAPPSERERELSQERGVSLLKARTGRTAGWPADRTVGRRWGLLDRASAPRHARIVPRGSRHIAADHHRQLFCRILWVPRSHEHGLDGGHPRKRGYSARYCAGILPPPLRPAVDAPTRVRGRSRGDRNIHPLREPRTAICHQSDRQ